MNASPKPDHLLARQTLDGPPADVAIKVYFARRSRSWRGLLLIVGGLGTAALLVYMRPGFDYGVALHVFFAALTFLALTAVLAIGIERLFDHPPTLAVFPGGLVLFPRRRAPGLLRWRDIRAIEVFTFGSGRFSAPFLSLVVDDPGLISAHLPLVQRTAYRIDRALTDGTRYFRPRSDFEQPVAEVVAELNAFREKLGQ